MLVMFSNFCVSWYIWKGFQGAAVTLAELGDYARAASLLDDLTKVNIILTYDILLKLPIICWEVSLVYGNYL